MAIGASRTSKIDELVRALAECGWAPVAGPSEGRLALNRQLIVLETNKRTISLRVSIYKIGGSSRGKPDERRFQITTTYGPRLRRDPKWIDVVLGYDESSGVFVGANPDRLAHGGATSNASTFFDKTGLERAAEDRLLVEPYPSKLFGGTEYHAFITRPRLAEYLFNVRQIHAGVYNGGGPFSSQTEGYPGEEAPLVLAEADAGGDVLVLRAEEGALQPFGVDARLVEAVEVGDRRRLADARLSPDAFERIRKRAEENGFLGEQFVVNLERAHLIREGRTDLAAKVEWTSQHWVDAGYDIRSFESDGAARFIEVKTTQGSRKVFEMSSNEWNEAVRLKSAYSIYRVTKIRRRPEVRILSNPAELLDRAAIRRTAAGWRISY